MTTDQTWQGGKMMGPFTITNSDVDASTSTNTLLLLQINTYYVNYIFWIKLSLPKEGVKKLVCTPVFFYPSL